MQTAFCLNCILEKSEELNSDDLPFLGIFLAPPEADSSQDTSFAKENTAHNFDGLCFDEPII